MSRAFVAAGYWLWWRWVLMVSSRDHEAYIHARWRLWQEERTMRNFLRGS